MKSIAFVLRGNSGKAKYYHGNIKTFVDVSKGLCALGLNPTILLPEDESHLTAKIEGITDGKVEIISYNYNNLNEIVTNKGLDYVVVDDDLTIMERISTIKNVKKAVFVEYLYGVNTNKGRKRKNSLKLLIGSFIPWRFVIHKYKSLLKKFDYVLANSQTTSYILQHFYDLRVAGVVYTPVGIDMRPLLNKLDKDLQRNGLLVFVGNMENDVYSRDILMELKQIKDNIGSVKIFSGSEISTSFFKEFGFDVYSNLSVKELVSLFRASEMTYVSTEYELFGLVGAESILCGTPVILDTYHPFMENVPFQSKAVMISHPKVSLFEAVRQMKKHHIDIDLARMAIEQDYSAEAGATELLHSLEIFGVE